MRSGKDKKYRVIQNLDAGAPEPEGKEKRMKVVKNFLKIIGNTPLLKLERVTKGLDVDVYVKCEHLNPSGSIKDRMALRMVEEAESEGKLRKGFTIIEQTTGNTGVALALVGALKGYRVRLFIPAQLTGTYNSTDRIKIMKYFGAEVEELKHGKFEQYLKNLSNEEKAAVAVAKRMKKCHEIENHDPKTWWANQLCNINNALANRDTTGREILNQLDGEIDGWVASIGTGGTILGVTEALKKKNPAVRVVGVEPDDDPRTDWVKRGTIHRFLREFGLPKMKFLTETMLDKGIPNEVIRVSDRDARKMAVRLCREEGLYCGMSSGANVYAALKTAKELGKGTNVVTVIVDRRDRYFSEHPNEHYVV